MPGVFAEVMKADPGCSKEILLGGFNKKIQIERMV
jgi:hypothetical protein